MVMYAKHQEKDTVVQAWKNPTILADLKNQTDVIDETYVIIYILTINYDTVLTFLLWSVCRTSLMDTHMKLNTSHSLDLLKNVDRIQTYHQTSPVTIPSMDEGRSVLPGIPCHIYVAI